MVGRTLGPYRIVERLGAGGMGEVYRAHDERLERDVAIKVLPPASFDDATARARLVREARTASKLNHPHICTIHEVGESDGHAYIAMELVEGEPLSDKLARGPLPAADVTRYGIQLADALGHAHDRNVVHRDVKSANVIVTPDGRLKVLDFGIAKRATRDDTGEATTHASMTGLGALAGTVAYMAPEVLRGEPADARSDTWSIGVVLYEMAAGARPFRGQTGFEVSSAILSQPLPPLPEEVPTSLRAVIERCLSKDAAHRYQRGAEVRAALEAVQSGAPAPRGSWKPVRGPAGWVSHAGAALLFVLVIAGALVVFDVWGMRQRIFRGGSAPRIQSLAVLPLANLSGDAEQEYFADGMTEALITDLARMGSLKRVIARATVMRYKGSDKPLPAIARELAVDALLTGAVLRSGARVRVTAQLIDGDTEDQIWADRYERDLRDVLTLQNEILTSIATGISARLSRQEKARLSAAPVVNPEAYDAVLKGASHLHRLSAENIQTALEYFQFALQKDPNYAPAYAGVANAWSSRGHMGLVQTREASRQAQPFLSKALELDDTLGMAHMSAGSVRLYMDWDWRAAETHLRRAIELSPSNSEAHLWYSDVLNVSGRPREALAAIERGRDLDPLNFFVQTSAAGRLMRLGRLDQALELLQRAVKTEPDLVLAHRYFWPLYHQRKMPDQAAAAARAFFAVGANTDVAEAIERGYREGGYPRAMLLGATTLEARAKTGYIQPTQIATLYAHAGEADRAFEWLDRAYEIRDSWLVFVKDDPRFAPLHADPRFQALVKRMKFPEAP